MKRHARLAEADRVDREFSELTAEQLQECLKALVACGCDGFVKETARKSMETSFYPYFLKLEVLAIEEKLKEPSLL